MKKKIRYTKKIGVLFTENTFNDVVDLAKKEDRSLCQTVRRIVEKYFKKED